MRSARIHLVNTPFLTGRPAGGRQLQLPAFCFLAYSDRLAGLSVTGKNHSAALVAPRFTKNHEVQIYCRSNRQPTRAP
jgi:hypothetical protein